MSTTSPPSTTGTDSTTDRDRDHLAGHGHTPDSWARALLSAVAAELEGRDGPLADQTVKLRVTARELPSPASDSQPTLVHPHLLLCVHAPGSEHGYCVVFPPTFVVHG